MFFAADTAPRFRNGAIALISSAAATIFVVGTIAYLQLRDDKRKICSVREIDPEKVEEESSPEKKADGE